MCAIWTAPWLKASSNVFCERGGFSCLTNLLELCLPPMIDLRKCEPYEINKFVGNFESVLIKHLSCIISRSCSSFTFLFFLLYLFKSALSCKETMNSFGMSCPSFRLDYSGTLCSIDNSSLFKSKLSKVNDLASILSSLSSLIFKLKDKPSTAYFEFSWLSV